MAAIMQPVGFEARYHEIAGQVGPLPQSRLQNLSELFRQRVFNHAHYSPEQMEFIDSKWGIIRDQACQNAGLGNWGIHLLGLDAVQLENVRNAFDRVIVGIETRGFNPFPEELSHFQRIVRHFLQDLDHPIDLWEHLTREHLHALYVAENPALVGDMREEIHRIFKEIFKQIGENDLFDIPVHDPKVTELLIGHLIGLYAFLAPPENSVVKIPQKIGDHWRLVDYTVSRLQLTNPRVASPVYASGLTPVADLEASRLLLFHGTAPMTTSGAFLCYIADFSPWFSVGEWIFEAGKGVIDAWMGPAVPNQKVHVYGISLGGSLAYHAGREYGDRAVVHAFVPPGLFPWTDRRERIAGETYCHEADPVSMLGLHPENDHFNFYRVVTSHDRIPSRAHHTASGCNPTLLLHSDSRYENARFIRKFNVFLHQLLAVPIVILLAAGWILRFLLIAMAQAIFALLVCGLRRCFPERPLPTRQGV